MILGIDHVAIAVPDAAAAAATFADILGHPGTRVEVVEGQATCVAFVPAAWPGGGARLEVLSPADGAGAVARFLERRGAGLHHVCFVTDGIEAEIARLAGRYAMVDDAPRRGHGGRIAFLHPRGTHGTLVELLERDRHGPPLAPPREGEGDRAHADARAREWLAAALAGDRRALSRALSAVEAGGPAGRAVAAAAGRATSGAAVVGITGAPGSGKSTLVGALARALRDGDPEATVAILAIDPSSPVTGGAVLGDRVRMGALAGDPNTFVRSVAGRGAGDGLADAAGDLLAVLRAAGFGTILLETVGVGQDALAVGSLADATVVVHAPGLGDAIQGLKSGLVDLADVIVVNKADLDGAAAMASALRFGRGDDATCPVIETTATTGAGIATLHEAITAALARPQDRSARARRGILRAAMAAARLHVLGAMSDGANGERLVEAVAAGRADPTVAACAILAMSAVRNEAVMPGGND